MGDGGRMHADEPDISPGLVRRLIEGQFPQWAGLGIETAGPAGTSNAMFRLGPDLAVRLPRRPGAAADIDKEHLWLPRLAPVLPAAVPVPVAMGLPGEGYPWRWSVCSWLEGENPAIAQPSQPELLADDLAAFASALHRVSPAGAPASYRCEPLSERDASTRAAIAQVHELVDAAAVIAVWEDALTAPGPAGRPVWIHADLQPGNLLIAASGRLSAVIDFGCAGLGDPAVDLIPAWYVLPADRARTAFRAAASEAEWARARGWALSIALLELSYYRNRNPRMASIAGHVIHEILAELVAGPAVPGGAPNDHQSIGSANHRSATAFPLRPWQRWSGPAYTPSQEALGTSREPGGPARQWHSSAQVAHRNLSSARRPWQRSSGRRPHGRLARKRGNGCCGRRPDRSLF